MSLRRIIWIVLDSVGVGALPDADLYGDAGTNTLGHLDQAVGGLRLPHLASLGLGNILPLIGSPPANQPRAAYGILAERSAGKDTTSGHWEMTGLVLDKPFPVYPHGFPPEVIDAFVAAIGRGVLGNTVASGTVIIAELGAEHQQTGKPIVYTSADSVFQIAAHEETIPVEELYRYCRLAREILTGPHAVGRVIARPFVGQPGGYTRTDRRHDFSLIPIGPTLLDKLQAAGLAVIGVGKIHDIFAGRGVSRNIHTHDNMDGVDQTLAAMAEAKTGLVFANLVDFDMRFGHRNDIAGYAQALQDFDRRLPELLAGLGPDDALVITADHGCDPTTPGTDHTREHAPLLLYGPRIKPIGVGRRESFADVGATVAELLGVPYGLAGQSFAGLIHS